MYFFHNGFVTASFRVFHNPLVGLSSLNLHEPKVCNLYSPASLSGWFMARQWEHHNSWHESIGTFVRWSHKAAGEKTSSDTMSHWSLERLSKKNNNMVTLTYKSPRHSQITARALRTGRGIFITFMSYIHWHSNITYLWRVLTPFLSLPEESYVEMWTGRSS